MLKGVSVGSSVGGDDVTLETAIVIEMLLPPMPGSAARMIIAGNGEARGAAAIMPSFTALARYTLPGADCVSDCHAESTTRLLFASKLNAVSGIDMCLPFELVNSKGPFPVTGVFAI